MAKLPAKDTLYLTSSNQKINKVSRDRLYFDSYEYCVQFKLQELSALRSKDHEQLEFYLEARKDMRQKNWGGVWRDYGQVYPITQQVKQNCHLLYNALESINSKYKLVINSNIGHIYTNSLVSIDDILYSPGVTILKVSRAVVNRPKDTIVRKNSQYAFRLYFKNQSISSTEKEHLRNFLAAQSARISPTFYDFLYTRPWTYLSDTFFVDFNDKSFVTMLHLVTPMKVKKILTIVKE